MYNYSIRDIKRQSQRKAQRRREEEKLRERLDKYYRKIDEEISIELNNEAWERILKQYPKAGWVYVIVNPSTPLVKVGMTKKTSPDDRARDLDNTSVAGKHEVRYAALVKNALEVEKCSHENLKKYRLDKRREWFSCSIRNAAEEIRQVSKEKGLFVKEASRNLDQSASDAEFAENEKARLQKQEREKELEQIYTRMHKARYERSVKDKMENELKEQEKLLREKLKKEEDMMKKKWREKTWIAKLFGSFR